MSMDSTDMYTFIGITVAMAFIVFFSLGVLVTTCICCMVKTRSKVLLHRPVESLVYEIVRVDQKMAATEMKPNAAYGVTAGQVEPDVYM